MAHAKYMTIVDGTVQEMHDDPEWLKGWAKANHLSGYLNEGTGGTDYPREILIVRVVSRVVRNEATPPKETYGKWKNSGN